MKKLILGVLTLVLAVNISVAQTGKKAYKEAEKLIKKYNSDPEANAGAIDEALAMYNTAFESEEVSGKVKNYNKKGDLLNSIVLEEMKLKILNPEYKLKNIELADEAMATFMTSFEKAEKKGDQKDALAGLQETESHLNNIATTFLQEGDYPMAYKYYAKSMDVVKMLESNDMETRLKDETLRKDQYYYTVAAGYYGKVDGEELLPILKEAEALGADKPLIYEALFSTVSKTDKEAGLAYLEQGIEQFPDDTGLLFAQINFYLQEGRLNELISKLETAIEKEPDNVSIYTTTGNVYDQLTTAEREAGNTEKADEYFDKAMSYYAKSLELDPKNFDAVYSQGALWYNKAAGLTPEINKYAEDFSAAATKKYKALKVEMDGYFDQAMPYFEKAYAMNSKDPNTLIALKEIYAKKDMLDKSKQMKEELEALGN